MRSFIITKMLMITTFFFTVVLKAETDDVGSTDYPQSTIRQETQGTDVCMLCGETNSSNPFDPINTRNLNILSHIALRESFKKYSDSDQVEQLIKSARKNVKSNPGRYDKIIDGNRMTYCYRAVKDALKAALFLPKGFVGGAMAKNATGDLSKIGFTNLLQNSDFKKILEVDPSAAPKGSVLVYETVRGVKGVSPYGHIEIKTTDSGEHGYISISESQRPTYGYRVPNQRKLVGVMVKEI